MTSSCVDEVPLLMLEEFRIMGRDLLLMDVLLPDHAHGKDDVVTRTIRDHWYR